jgi:hypothetical protein
MIRFAYKVNLEKFTRGSEKSTPQRGDTSSESRENVIIGNGKVTGNIL